MFDVDALFTFTYVIKLLVLTSETKKLLRNLSFFHGPSATNFQACSDPNPKPTFAYKLFFF